MPFWKQALLAIVILSLGGVAAATYVPALRPLFDRLGLVSALERFGLIDAAPELAVVSAARGGAGAGAVKVVAALVETRAMNDVINAIGTARAARSVRLTADIAGRIVALNAASGAYVEAGTVIAELDDEAARIALDRADLILSDAQTAAARQRRLQASGASTDLLAEEAKLAEKTAELGKREAEFELSRHKIVTPISGWLGILAVEIGDQIAPADEIAVVQDRSSLIVDFRVPERMIALLSPGIEVGAAPLSQNGPPLTGKIVALDSRVDDSSRTLRVQAAIANQNDLLRPGMALSVTLNITGAAHPFVDPLAIQWDTNGAYIWVIRNGKADHLPIHILQRDSDAVLIDGDLSPSDVVVTEGVQALRKGSLVDVVKSGDLIPPNPAPKS